MYQLNKFPILCPYKTLNIIKTNYKQLKSNKHERDFAHAYSNSCEGNYWCSYEIICRNCKKENKALLKDTVKSTSENALKETMKFVDANLAEQRKRTRNLIISGVDEVEEENCGETVFQMLSHIDGSFKKDDIANCRRIGQKKQEENDAESEVKPRLLLVTLRYEQDALFFHNCGIGRKYRESCWINADLTKSERDARYKLRCAKREKKAKSTETAVEVDAQEADDGNAKN